MELQGQGIGITEMLNAMAAQQPVYTVPAYGSLEATYAQYPQYVAQVTHATYLATPATTHQVTGHTIQEQSEHLDRYEDSRKPRERREHRDHDRDRRSRDRDRDYRDRRDRDRDRDRDRRDRDREHRHRDDDRDRSPRRDSDRDYDRDSLYDEDSRGSDYKSMTPNNTIMVRGLAQHIKENDIRADILACNLMPKDIRLVRKKESGASRGFAFVEFATVHDAARWMDSKQGILILQDVYRATLQYSIPKDSSDRPLKNTDWFCIRCGAHNFKRRDSCFKCSTPRHESDMGEDGTEEICSYPTNTLIIRGLDVLSTEEHVLESIQEASSDLPIRSVRIGRDPLTNTSRGVCYVELNSVLDSMQLYNKISDDPPMVDNRETSIAYCKLHQGNNHSSGSQQQNHQPLEYTAGADIKKLAEYSASVYAQTPEEHAAYVEYYTLYYQQQADATTTGTQSDSVNVAAAVAQSALKAMQQKTGVAPLPQSQISSVSPASFQSTEAAEEYPRYPTPDITTYKYDETSGYYYDASTSLYYDANSTYYYNSETCQYLYWDAERSTYLPAPTGDESQEGGDNRKDRKEKDKDRQDKVKVAKKIAKDMERWAKAQNKRNETVCKSMTAEQGGPSSGPDGQSGAADAAFAVLLERRDRPPVDKQTFQMHVKKENPSALGVMKSGLVAAYGGDNSESEEEKEMPYEPERYEQKLIDVAKMACLLCKRQFPNKDALTKHVKLSSLHKSNLESYAKNAEGEMQQYRDRAKERRDKFGQPNMPPPNKLKERYIAAREEVESSQYEEPTREGIGEDNIGNRMMKSMGWSDGMGLGKSNQGRTNIIEAERRIATAGLGMQGSAYSVAGDSYKDCVKKMMFHRYQELDAMEKSHK